MMTAQALAMTLSNIGYKVGKVVEADHNNDGTVELAYTNVRVQVGVGYAIVYRVLDDGSRRYEQTRRTACGVIIDLVSVLKQELAA